MTPPNLFYNYLAYQRYNIAHLVNNMAPNSKLLYCHSLSNPTAAKRLYFMSLLCDQIYEYKKLLEHKKDQLNTLLLSLRGH